MLKSIRNTLANFCGGFVMLAATLVFNALYFRIAAPDVFGIISLLLTATLISPALDLGTGRTAGRIIAIDLPHAHEARSLRDAVVTLQLGNALVAVAIAVLLALAAPLVARTWLDSAALSTSDVTGAVALIAGALGLLIPRNFVIACLNGMKRQVAANAFGSVFAVIRGGAGVTALYASDAPLMAFLWSQLAVLALESIFAIAVLWRLMPAAPGRPCLTGDTIRTSWRFALGDGASVAIGTFMMHGDKILLSTLLPLSSYGAYTLISAFATGIGRFTSPFSAAFLPHFVELHAQNRADELRQDYLVSTQLLSTMILPLAATMVVFAPEIVETLLGRTVNVAHLPLAFAVLVVATILNNLVHLPHGVQLAAGNSMTAFHVSVVNVVVYLILILILTSPLGVLGPALGLLAICLVGFAIMVRVTNRLLDIGFLRWAGHSIGRPLAGAIAVVAVARLVVPDKPGLVVGAVLLIAIVFLAMLAALLVSPNARRALRHLAGDGDPSGSSRPADDRGGLV